MADYYRPPPGDPNIKKGDKVNSLVKDYGGAVGQEGALLNGLMAMGYDPALIRSLADADPNRRYLDDAVTRALRAGISEDDIRDALKATRLAAEGKPEEATRALRRNRADLPPEAAAAWDAMANRQPLPFLDRGQLSPPAVPAAPTAATPSPAAAPVAKVGGPRMQIAGPAPAAPAAKTPAAAGTTPAANTTPAAGGAVDTTEKLAPNASPDQALQFIREHYGYGAWIAEQKPVWDILVAAAKDGHWSDARLNGALGATDFFKNNQGSVIQWMNTEANDPATAKAQVDQKVNDVIGKAQTLGMDLDPERARQIATDAKRFGWDDTQLTKAVGHEYHYNPTMAQKGIAKQLRDTARLYGVPMTDAGMDDWGRRVGAGDASADDFKATMINQAKSLFPTLAGDLDRGVTVKDIFDPYAKLAASTLGVDEGTIDILDPKWQRPLQSTDGKNPTRMSTFDWTRTLRTDATYDFDHTDNARQEAAQFAHQLRQGFGLA